jgi:predicted amidohydrolase
MPRKIWVATTAFGGGGPTVRHNRDKAEALIERAAMDRPDVICLPETFTSTGVGATRAAELAEPIPGPTTDMVRNLARKHSTNIICPLLEKRGEVVHNTAAVIDRRGEIVGCYRKLHPVTTSSDFTEFERGVQPGQDVQVFELDFGRIGVLICFDIQWPREWRALAELGAEMVFWPSAYDGGFPLRARAWDHHTYVVSSVQTHSSRIIDITGEVILETGRRSAVAVARIDLEKRCFHTDFNASQIPAIKGKYGRDVTIRLLHDEAVMTLESQRDGLTVADLMEEFDLELVPDYVARHERAEESTREGRAPPPQKPRRVPAQWV